jgi:electron transfer flavoprotein beta subunit
MRIVVLVKEVPDTWSARTLSLETGLTDRKSGESVLDEIGERALEVALAYADAHPGTEVTVLSMGRSGADTTIRKGLAMGAASAVQVVDDELLGADATLTADVLAAALRRIGFDLVVAGNQSTDGTGGVVPAMIAELLDVPAATCLASVAIEDGEVRGVRSADGATAHVSAELPAVISITEALPDARFPNFKGIMAAKKKPFETLSLADLDVDPLDAGASRSIVLAARERPARAAGTTLVDEGDAGEQLADFLLRNRLV